MLKEARTRTLHVVCEAIHLADEVARIAAAERDGGPAASPPRGTGAAKGAKGALASTSVVWAACDGLVELERGGLAGVMVARARQHREALLDMIRELREYAAEDGDGDGDGDEARFSGGEGEGEEDEDEDEDDLGAGDRLGGGEAAQAMRRQLDASLKRASTVAVLFQALTKRRLRTYPAQPPPGSAPGSARARVDTADRLVAAMRAVEDAADEIAAEAYGGDAGAVAAAAERCCRVADGAAALVERDWEGREDKFTAWSRRWREVLAGSGAGAVEEAGGK